MFLNAFIVIFAINVSFLWVHSYQNPFYDVWTVFRHFGETFTFKISPWKSFMTFKTIMKLRLYLSSVILTSEIYQ